MKRETAYALLIMIVGLLITIFGIVSHDSVCFFICYDYVIIGILVLSVGIVIGLVTHWRVS